jgi:hypothetical protein
VCVCVCVCEMGFFKIGSPDLFAWDSNSDPPKLHYLSS